MTKRKYFLWFLTLLVLNLSIRLIIFHSTELFSFSDFRHHLGAIEKIANGNSVPLVSGNYLFAISYMGYFFKYIAGNLDYFFLLNSLIGTAASAIISILVLKVTQNKKAPLITLLLLSMYSEFLVFSSLFYTVILMVFLLSVLVLLFFEYYNSVLKYARVVYLILISVVIFTSFLFKQELLFLPLFMFISLIVFRKNREFVRKTTGLVITTLLATVLFYGSGLTHKTGNKLANDFIFFGHTDYGGDGGEGSLIYPENKERYNEAWKAYLDKNSISSPTITDRNRFQADEIKKFITHHPGRWVKLQFTKFFRTFGVVPEGVSFKILYSGLLKDKLWLTSFVVVVPVALIIVAFILFFDYNSLRNLIGSGPRAQSSGQSPRPHPAPCTLRPAPDRSGLRAQGSEQFLVIYLTLFIYYIIAICFFGHYQERYRIPVMVVFIIPALGYFIAMFNRKEFFNRNSLVIKGVIVSIFLVTWLIQTQNAVDNKQRLDNVIEKIDKSSRK